MKGSLWISLIFAVICFLVVLDQSWHVQGIITTKDRVALVALALHNDEIKDAMGWDGTPECSWAGVTCSGSVIQSQSVIALTIAPPYLPQSFTSELPEFDDEGFESLATLDLRANWTGDTINWMKENNFAALNSLTIVASGALDAGGLHSGFLKLTKLTSLTLVGMNMNGPLTGLSNLTQLQNLILARNAFTSLPDLSSLSLRILDLNTNKITGNIPNWITNLPLTKLDLSANQFEGTLPASLGQLPSLTSLYLNNNQLEGRFPRSFANLTSLMFLNISNNDICTKNVEKILGQVPSLVICDVTENYCECPASFQTCCANFIKKTPGPAPSLIGTTSGFTDAISTIAASTSTISSSSTTATTTTTSPAPTPCVDYECMCSSDLTAFASNAACIRGKWLVKGSVENGGTTIIGQPDIIIIDGAFSQTENGTIEIHTNNSRQNPYLQSQQGMSLNGTLLILLAEPVQQNTTVTVLSSTSGITGNFSSVRVQNQDKSQLTCHTGAPQYTGSSMSVIVSPTACPKEGSNMTYYIIAAAAGVAIVILIIIAAAIGIIVYYKYKSGRGGAYQKALMSSHENSMDRTQSIL